MVHDAGPGPPAPPASVFAEVLRLAGDGDAEGVGLDAGAAVSRLSTQDLEEVRKMINPPVVVRRTLEATFLLLNGSKASAQLTPPTWTKVQKMLTSATFLPRMQAYDAASLRDAPALTAYVAAEYFVGTGRSRSSPVEQRWRGSFERLRSKTVSCGDGSPSSPGGSSSPKRSTITAGATITGGLGAAPAARSSLRSSNLPGLPGVGVRRTWTTSMLKELTQAEEPLTFQRVTRASQAVGALFRWCTATLAEALSPEPESPSRRASAVGAAEGRAEGDGREELAAERRASSSSRPGTSSSTSGASRRASAIDPERSRRRSHSQPSHAPPQQPPAQPPWQQALRLAHQRPLKPPPSQQRQPPQAPQPQQHEQPSQAQQPQELQPEVLLPQPQSQSQQHREAQPQDPALAPRSLAPQAPLQQVVQSQPLPAQLPPRSTSPASPASPAAAAAAAAAAATSPTAALAASAASPAAASAAGAVAAVGAAVAGRGSLGAAASAAKLPFQEDSPLPARAASKPSLAAEPAPAAGASPSASPVAGQRAAGLRDADAAAGEAPSFALGPVLPPRRRTAAAAEAAAKQAEVEVAASTAGAAAAAAERKPDRHFEIAVAFVHGSGRLLDEGEAALQTLAATISMREALRIELVSSPAWIENGATAESRLRTVEQFLSNEGLACSVSSESRTTSDDQEPGVTCQVLLDGDAQLRDFYLQVAGRISDQTRSIAEWLEDNFQTCKH